MTKIIAGNLRKSYINHLKQKEVVFSNLCLEANKGEVTLIMGPSGSGKTSLLNIISTIDPIEKGELTIGDAHVHTMNENQRARLRSKKIGFVFQSFALIPEFTVIDNCTVPLMMNGYSKKEAVKKAKEMLEFLNSDINIHKFPKELSGGQQQRVAIARALVNHPEIIIADEPTGNIDAECSLKIKRKLYEIAKEENLCVVIVSHDKDFINYADKLYEFEINKDYKGKNDQVKSTLVEI